MYREALALTVQSHRPDTEVLLVSEAALDGQVDGFAPHLLVRNDGGAAFPEGLLGSGTRTSWRDLLADEAVDRLLGQRAGH